MTELDWNKVDYDQLTERQRDGLARTVQTRWNTGKSDRLWIEACDRHQYLGTYENLLAHEISQRLKTACMEHYGMDFSPAHSARVEFKRAGSRQENNEHCSVKISLSAAGSFNRIYSDLVSAGKNPDFSSINIMDRINNDTGCWVRVPGSGAKGFDPLVALINDAVLVPSGIEPIDTKEVEARVRQQLAIVSETFPTR